MIQGTFPHRPPQFHPKDTMTTILIPRIKERVDQITQNKIIGKVIHQIQEIICQERIFNSTTTMMKAVVTLIMITCPTRQRMLCNLQK